MERACRGRNASSFALEPLNVLKWLISHNATLAHSSDWYDGHFPLSVQMWAIEGVYFVVTRSTGPSPIQEWRVYAPIPEGPGLDLEVLLEAARKAKKLQNDFRPDGELSVSRSP